MKRSQRTLQERFSIIRAYQDIEKEKGAKTKIVKSFNLPSISCLNAILSKSDDITKAYECNAPSKRLKLRYGSHPKLDQALYDWFLSMRSNNVEVSGNLLSQQAKIIAESLKINGFTASQGYLDRFKKRYGISFKKFYGHAGSVDENTVHDWNAKLKELIKDYDPKDIFNWDESALFYLQPKNASLVSRSEANDKNLRGHKQEKHRITILFGCSMTGEKLMPVIIGKYKTPRGFRNSRTPLDYYSSSNAWMTSTLFESLLKKFDRSMGVQNRKVLLFLDNCSAHPKIKLNNVTLCFFPPNVTAKCQPLDMGIIAAFKLHYKSMVEMKKVQALNMGLQLPKMSLFEALFNIKNVWTNKISDECVKNCFKKASFVMEETSYLEPEIFEAEYLPEIFTDDDIMTSEPMNEDVNTEQIESEICPIESDIEEEEVELVKDDDAYKYAQNLEKYFSMCGDSEKRGMAEKLKNSIYNNIMNKKTQKSITDFFMST